MSTTFENIEKTYIYPAWVPVDVNGGLTGNYVSMKYYRHAMVIFMIGACTRSANITFNRAKSVTGTSAEAWTGWDNVAKNANVSAYNGEDSSDTKDLTMTAVSSYTLATGTTANQLLVVEFDAIDLGGDDWDCFAPVISDPGGTGDVIGCLVILTDPRYSGVQSNPPNARTN